MILLTGRVVSFLYMGVVPCRRAGARKEKIAETLIFSHIVYVCVCELRGYQIHDFGYKSMVTRCSF